MKCLICGVELQESNRFCGICGTPNPDFKENFPNKNNELVENSPESVENNVENVENSDKICVENVVENVENVSPVEEKSDEVLSSSFDNIGEKADEDSVCGSDERNEDHFDTEVNSADTAEQVTISTDEEDRTDNAPETPKETNDFDLSRENPPQTAEERKNFGAGAATPYNIPPTPYGGYQTQNHGYPQQFSQSLPQKEKRVCSLSVVIFCAVVIFILSIVCGVLGGLYAAERSKRISRTGMSYSDGAYIVTMENTGE